MDNIEVEIRSFISDDEYDRLLEYFRQNAKLIKEDTQETHYFDCEMDVRIQQNKDSTEIKVKAGKIHDETREEFVIECKEGDFHLLKRLFSTLGLNNTIKWFRERKKFQWNNIIACVDYNKGYGKIFELEIQANDTTKAQALEILKEKFKDLNIEITPREVFEERFKHYETHWKELTKE